MEHSPKAIKTTHRLLPFYATLVILIAMIACAQEPVTLAVTQKAPIAALPSTTSVSSTVHKAFFGQQIVFMSDRSGQELYVMQLDGQGLRQLTNTPNYSDRNPAISPDGKFLVYQYVWVAKKEFNLMLLPLDGGPLVQLPNSGTFCVNRVSFSPDGSTVVFCGEPTDSYDMDIYSMPLEGNGQWTQLSPNDPLIQSYLSPDWSPDGSKIVFSRCYREKTGCDLALMNPDGSGLTALTDTPGVSETDPAWSPNGKQIAYRQEHDGAFNVYVMNSDGSNPHPLVTLDINEIFPSRPEWSPDGLYLLIDMKFPAGDNFDVVLFSSNAYLTAWSDIIDCTPEMFMTGKCAALRLTDAPGYDGMAVWLGR